MKTLQRLFCVLECRKGVSAQADPLSDCGGQIKFRFPVKSFPGRGVCGSGEAAVSAIA
ncbi:MAG: hypothetical protein MR033_00110 [Clostridiales bacterium]|nr:hypothetical protein [Clostridiales bacterium]